VPQLSAIKILNWYTRAPTSGQIFEVVSAREGPRRKWIPTARTATNYHSGNEYFVINFARFHCSNCEHFRPAGAKPHSATINYDGVMPHSIYYAARRTSCQIIPIRLQSSSVLLVRMFEPFEGSFILAIYFAEEKFFEELF